MPMQRDELVRHLDAYLDLGAFPEDPSLNGLQVEGAAEVSKVAVAVDCSISTFEQAAAAGADMLIVHHGLFWGAPLTVTGPHRRRLRLLLEHDINLYAAHLPLDAHPQVGNNWGLARLLGLVDATPFGSWRGRALGVAGALPAPLSLRDLADLLERTLGESVLVHAGGPNEVSRLGIVSGSAASMIQEAAHAGLDGLLTGEPKHDHFYDPFERGINALYAGHYMTETVGVKLLAEELERRFGLETEFLLLPTGL
jgi:dinuclear metal center YbgI/SA1388 family protein